MTVPALPRLRRAAPEDAGIVRDLTRRAYAKWVPVIGREPQPMTADYDSAVRDHRVDLLVEAGEVLALIETVLRPDDLLIENIAVDPAQQGRGFGDALLAHAERIARDGRRTAVRLYTNALMDMNIAFYARRGYRHEREEVVAVGRRVHMIKVLGAEDP